MLQDWFDSIVKWEKEKDQVKQVESQNLVCALNEF